MEDQENNEIKILIDALKYTSNIIVDLTNKLNIQEEKINIFENKLNKIQKLSIENNLKLKKININDMTLNNGYKNNKNIKNNINTKSLENNISDEISGYIIEENTNSKMNILNNIKNNITIEESGNKNKIDKLIGSIITRKKLLSKMINDNNEKSILTEYEIDNNKKLNNTELTNKSENINTQKTNNYENIKNDEFEQDKIIDAQNNDLNKANNILKQIRRRGNFVRKM
jgi:hypothetical protein